MVPPFDLTSGNLPPGIHEATWDEVVERFGTSPRRRALLAGLEAALRLLRGFGCRRCYLDGSFVTAKERPGDYDGSWEVDGVDIVRLVQEAPLLWDDTRGRPNQKREYGGDLFPVRLAGDSFDRIIFEDFQRDATTRAPKGIVALDLDSLS